MQIKESLRIKYSTKTFANTYLKYKRFKSLNLLYFSPSNSYTSLITTIPMNLTIRLIILFTLISVPLLAQYNPPPPNIDPPVPIDGGITALLIAGGAMGYRKYKMKQA